MDKFVNFVSYLKREKRDEFYITHKEIEEIIGQPLCKSAYKYREYWDISGTHRFANLIYDCGYKVSPDLDHQRIKLYRYDK